MIEGSTIAVLNESGQLDGNCPCDTEAISFELDVAGKTLPFCINVVSKQAALADIVPLARTISTKIALAFLDTLSKKGQFVTCHKRCSTCCSYMIPLSIPEVFRLREELLAMPSDKSSRILKSCTIAAKRTLEKIPRYINTDKPTENNSASMDQLSKWYAGLKMDCPFLSEGLCSVYEQRPLACREHIITGSNFFCQPDNGGEPNVVPMPVSVLEVLGRWTAELENSDIQAVMLPLALPWSQNNLSYAERTWPAKMMVERFIEILKDAAAKNSETPAVPA